MSDQFSSVRSQGIMARLWTTLIRRRANPAGPVDGLRLSTVPMCVPADLDLVTPTMRVVVVEDACWALAMDSWRERAPHRWRWAERRAWAAEGRTLDAKRERLRALATEAPSDGPARKR